jgi:hypothetical protein
LQAEALAVAYVNVGVLFPSLLIPTLGFRLLAKDPPSPAAAALVAPPEGATTSCALEYADGDGTSVEGNDHDKEVRLDMGGAHIRAANGHVNRGKRGVASGRCTAACCCAASEKAGRALNYNEAIPSLPLFPPHSASFLLPDISGSHKTAGGALAEAASVLEVSAGLSRHRIMLSR